MTRHQRQAIAAEQFRQLPPDVYRLLVEALRRSAQGIPPRAAADLLFGGALPAGIKP